MEKPLSEKKLHVIPYIPGIAEYAAIVRSELLNRKDPDFIIAVDLPHGLEGKVMEAVKKLPQASVIIDQLFRGIPVIPSSAPIEAVRSYRETGADLRFIDSSLPVPGNCDDFRFFIDQCNLFGIDKVIKILEIMAFLHRIF